MVYRRPILLRRRYALLGTDIAYATTRASSTSRATTLSTTADSVPAYGMSSTERSYGATSALVLRHRLPT
eukprot:1265640-Rhodomonas_salina.2